MVRLTFALFCATVALLSVTVSAKNQDLFVGSRIYGDYLLEQQDVDVGSFPGFVKEKTVTIKGNGVAKITRVEAYDLKSKKTSAMPAIVSGGPGYSFVTIDFKSHRGHGIHFLVKVFGK